MNRKYIIYAAVALVAALGSNMFYQNTIVLWDGYAYEVSLTTEPIPELTVAVTATDLTSNLLVRDALEAAPTVVDDFATMDELKTLVMTKGQSLGSGLVFIETDDATYEVTHTMYGGMDDQPIFLYASWILAIVAVGLAINAFRN